MTQQTEQDDVQGHLFWIIVGVTALATVTGSATVIAVGHYATNSEGTLKGIEPREQLAGGGGQTPR